ncbi:MAG: ABC transporter permease [Deltaproteobacteria bacterium]|jgi:peptide/nickel transport system permease protein|nr:ABC transporter permease [Deltaproteobacteria bacterium]
MLKYTLKRLVMMIPSLIGITLVSFVVIHLAPGEPADMVVDLNPQASLTARSRLNEIYGLDKPLHVQYWNWIKDLASLDLGRSMSPDRRPVRDKIAERLPVTLALNVCSMGLIILISLPLGLLSAVRAGSFFDKSSTVVVFVFFAAPSFWLALLGMWLFGVKLGWLPTSGLTSLNYDQLDSWGKFSDLARHLVMPVLISSLGGLAGLSRYLRSNMLEIIRQDFLTTARAKGLPERVVVWKHALRNALIPVITILGLSVPGLVGGSVIMESVYAIPGLGQLFYIGVMGRDYPLVMGGLVIGAVLTLLGNLLADLGYALADPRVRDQAFKGAGS